MAGNVDTPFNRLFRRRAEETGIVEAQLRLLDGFRSANAEVVYTGVKYQQGLPRGQSEFPAMVHPLRLRLPHGGHSRCRADR